MTLLGGVFVASENVYMLNILKVLKKKKKKVLCRHFQAISNLTGFLCTGHIIEGLNSSVQYSCEHFLYSVQC